jgi:hypothetical protein
MTPDKAIDQRNTPFVIGVSGHLDLSATSLEHARGAVTSFLRSLSEQLPDTQIRVLTGMAAGADLLVAQAALELGFELDAVLPMPLEQYAEDFEPSALESLQNLLRHPRARCIELSLAEGTLGTASIAGVVHRDEHYVALTRTIARTCNLLLALWDGQSSALPGGTSDTVLRYLGVRTDRNPQEIQLAFAEASEDRDPHSQLVYWIPVTRVTTPSPTPDLGSPCFLSGLGDNLLQRWHTMPSRLQTQLARLNEYNREYCELARRGRAGEAPNALMGTLKGEVPVPASARLELEQIDAQYGKADALAMYFQRRSDRLFGFFSGMTFAMGLAYLTYEKFLEVRLLLFAYLVVLTLSLSLYFLLHGRYWFAKHLMCRALAETLRAKFYLRLAGAEHLVDADKVLSLSGIDRFHGFSWIGHVLTSLNSPAFRRAPEPDSEHVHLKGVEAAWIESQRRYFVSKVARLERDSRHIRRLKRGLLCVILLVILSLIVISDAGHHVLLASGITLKNALTFSMGLTAVVLGVWELHQNKMATRELLWQYRNQLEHFSRARDALLRTTSTSRRREILAALGKDSLMESYLWTIHRYHREHEPPGRGA